MMNRPTNLDWGKGERENRRTGEPEDGRTGGRENWRTGEPEDGLQMCATSIAESSATCQAGQS